MPWTNTYEILNPFVKKYSLWPRITIWQNCSTEMGKGEILKAWTEAVGPSVYLERFTSVKINGIYQFGLECLQMNTANSID